MILLDSHAWVWWISDPSLLSTRSRRAIEGAAENNAVWVSCISAWEIALLAKRGRLRLKMEVAEWIKRSEQLPFLYFIPVDNAAAVKSVHLSEPFHDDPADRIIVATAIVRDVPLVTKDEKIRRYRAVQTLW